MAARHEPKAGDYVILEIRDSGIGLDEETKSKIFEPFFTTKFTGRGLSFAAAQGIVRSSKGWISVANTPGAGSIFQVYIPAVPAAVHSHHKDVFVNSSARPELETMLAIDDEEIISKSSATGLGKGRLSRLASRRR